jgi:AraC family transcriptional regulator
MWPDSACRTDIALEAGFTHPSHMARCMRRVLGLSPSQIAARTSMD